MSPPVGVQTPATPAAGVQTPATLPQSTGADFVGGSKRLLDDSSHLVVASYSLRRQERERLNLQVHYKEIIPMQTQVYI